MIVDLLAWIAIGLLVLTGGVKLFYYTNAPVALAAVLDVVTMVVGVVVLRLLAQVVIDIPDIALLKKLSKEIKVAKEDASSD